MKKRSTQVREWLEAAADGKADDERVTFTAGECRARAKQLKEINARDEQRDKKRHPRKRTAKKPAKRS